MVIFADLIGPKLSQIFDPLIHTDASELNNFTLCIQVVFLFLSTCLRSISIYLGRLKRADFESACDTS